MGIVIVLAAALAWWLHKRGELTPALIRFAGTGAAGFIALRMFASGKPLLGVVAGGIAWAWWVLQAPTAGGGPEARARALLGLAPGADEAAIQAAWRARMQDAHPDAGGSDAAARAVTEARDLLLARRRSGNENDART